MKHLWTPLFWVLAGLALLVAFIAIVMASIADNGTVVASVVAGVLAIAAIVVAPFANAEVKANSEWATEHDVRVNEASVASAKAAAEVEANRRQEMLDQTLRFIDTHNCDPELINAILDKEIEQGKIEVQKSIKDYADRFDGLTKKVNKIDDYAKDLGRKHNRMADEYSQLSKKIEDLSNSGFKVSLNLN